MPLRNKLKYIFAILFLQFFVFINCALAQFASLSGKIIDANTNKGLKLATITVINAKDSTLISFTKTNEQGDYLIKNIPFKSTLIIYSYPGYANYSDSVIFTSPDEIKMKDITITTKAKLLEEVIVKQKISAIRFKGDTMEMIADSFKVGANANVQELLKKMPGITINSKGEITAQGEKVNKVFVDGEEFFSDDPAVVTQGLRADGIDKVQVYDKKSDNATFTGIDDGEKTKVINLKLKENAKKGYFGKVDIGSDFDKYRTAKGMMNVFRGKSKFAAYVTNDNTKFDGLDWSDRTNYGEDLNRNTEVNDNGGISMWSNGDEFSWSSGLPTSTTAGLHYNKKWNENKVNSINTFQHNNLALNGLNTNKQQSILSDSSSIFSNSNSNFNSQKVRNKLRTTFDWKIDSTSELKIIATGTKINNETSSNFFEQNNNQKSIKLNDIVRSTKSKTTTSTFATNLSYRKRFKKKGRTVSANVDLNLNDNNGASFLNADNKFYTNGLANQLIDQEKTNDEINTGLNGRIAYTEPLTKKVFLETSVKLNLNKNNSLRNTLEQTTLGSKIYNKKIDSLSNHFVFNNTGYIGGMSLKYNNKKI